MAKIKANIFQEESQIRNSERIRDLAEVFTAEKEVSAMLNLLEPITSKLDSRFLEPSCGNGNFLVSILDRKLKTVSSRYKNQIEYEFLTIVATASIYGVDIDIQNVREARNRMKERIIDHYSNVLNTRTRSEYFDKIIDLVLKTNVICGDMINGINNIKFIEYTSPKPNKIQIVADSAKIEPWQNLQLIANVFDSLGNKMLNQTITWNTSDSLIARVN